MDIKKREVISLYDFLGRMQKNGVTLDTVDWKVLSDNKSMLEDSLKEIDDSRRELVKTHSDGNLDDSEVIKVSDSKMEIFQKEYIELLESKVKVNFNTINVSNLGESMNGEVGIWEFMKFMVTK